MNFVAPLPLFCLFPFNMPFLGWLPGFSPLPLQLLSLLRHCQIVLYHKMRKAAVTDIELQLAWTPL